MSNGSSVGIVTTLNDLLAASFHTASATRLPSRLNVSGSGPNALAGFVLLVV